MRPQNGNGPPERAARLTIITAETPPPRGVASQSVHAAHDLAAWAAAVAHLHRLGLPAAAPPFPAAWLRRRGVVVDWVSAA